MGIDKEYTFLLHHSSVNIARWEREAGPAAAALVEPLKEKFFTGKSLVFYHEITGDRNVRRTIASGALLSYDKIKAQDGKVEGSHTIAKNTVHNIFNNIRMAEDVYKNSVYFRLLAGDQSKRNVGEGVYLSHDSMPEKAWFNFWDPGYIDRFDVEDAMFSPTVSGGFNYEDVFVGGHIEDALVLQAMRYLAYARCISTRNPEKYKTPKKVLEAFEKCGSASFRRSLLCDENPDMVELEAKYLGSKKFQDHFSRALTFVLADVAQVGQVTLPVRVDVRDAVLAYQGSRRTVREWQKDQGALLVIPELA